MTLKQTLLGAALSGLMVASAGCKTAHKTDAGHSAAMDPPKGECHGINGCKGKGECGGKGHSCAGKNACKGKGWLMTTKEDCASKKGKFKM